MEGGSRAVSWERAVQRGWGAGVPRAAVKLRLEGESQPGPEDRCLVYR